MQYMLLVTGGCGYVGRRVVTQLANQGYKVVVVDKISPQERKIDFPKGVEFRKADLRVKEEAERALKGADYILHLAANIGSLAYMDKYKADIIQENCAIDSNVYPICVRYGVKGIVYSSSSMVFQHPPKFPYDEKDIAKINPPSNIYGFSKLIGEYCCKAYHSQYNLPYVIFRYHGIYGPGEAPKGTGPSDIHVIPALIDKIAIKKQYPVELVGDPKSSRSFVYIDDAVDATIKIIDQVIKKNKKVINQEFNIADSNHITIEDLAKIVWNIAGHEKPFQYVHIPSTHNTALRREVDITKAKNDLGWSPTTPLKEGIKKTTEWIISQQGVPYQLIDKQSSLLQDLAEG